MRQQTFHRLRRQVNQPVLKEPNDPTVPQLKVQPSLRDLQLEPQQGEDPATTIYYLRSYLNQMVVDNRKLKHLVEQQSQQIAFLEDLLNQRFYQLEAVRKSKEEIERAVHHVSNINNNYLEELNRRGREVEELQQRLITAQGPSTRSIQFGKASNGDYQKLLGKYLRLQAKYSSLKEKLAYIGESQLGTSTVSASSLLDEIKNYVTNIKSRNSLLKDCEKLGSARVH